MARAMGPQNVATLQEITRLIDTCFSSKSLLQAKLVHQYLIKSFQPSNPSYSSSPFEERLVTLYAQCNGLQLARQVFDVIPQRPRDVVTWNHLIRGYAWNGPFEEAIQLYIEMLGCGVQPSKYTLPFVLKACSGSGAVREGEAIHSRARRMGLDKDVYVCTALVDMYVKCGYLDKARKVFEEMPERDVVAWNSMIAGFSLHGVGYYDKVIEFLVQMQKEVRPNSSTMAAVLPALAQAKALNQGRELHGFCVRHGFDCDVVVATGMLDMYGKCQCVAYARRIFDRMGSIRNEVTWGAIIGAYVECDMLDQFLELFCQMMLVKDDRKLVLSEPILANTLRGCAKLTDLISGRCLHCCTIKLGFISDMMIANTMLSVYAKCGILNDVLNFFYSMNMKDTVSFSAVISGCVQSGNAKEALKLFREMQSAGIHPDTATMVSILPAYSYLAAQRYGYCGHAFALVSGFTADIGVCNALIDMYAKCGKIDVSRKFFDRLNERDIITWNAMINGYGIHGLGREALLLLESMQSKGINPDDITFINLLFACSHSGLVSEGKTLFNSMTKDFGITPTKEHYICMVDLLSRAGLFDEVYRLIDRMPFDPDAQVWEPLLAACRTYKNVELGEDVLKKITMLGLETSGNFVLMSNMYSAAGRWEDAEQVRILQKHQGLKKSPGFSWIEVGGITHAFVGGDTSHPHSAQIYRKLDELIASMRSLGYQAESSYVLQDIEEEEKEGALLYHSEKLAIAYGIVCLRPDKPILVNKNLRVCGDCHAAIKYISRIIKRDIIVRDATRFHYFRDGICSCGEFW